MGQACNLMINVQDLAAAIPLLLRTAFGIEVRSVSYQNQSRHEAEVHGPKYCGYCLRPHTHARMAF